MPAESDSILRQMADERSQEYQALDLLVVPSPILNEQGDTFLDVDPLTGLYAGGHLRLLAAVEFSRRYAPREIVVVGGLDPKHGSRMTQAMEQFITERNGSANVQRINSLPCTRHNLIALFNQLGERLERKRVGILTNDYHLPRFLAFWSQLRKDYEFRIADPLAIRAESICKPTEAEVDAKAVDARRELEERGLADLQAGKYVDRCLSQLAKFGHVLDLYPNWYLAPNER